MRWRMANLYKCRDEGAGKPIHFNPRPEQWEVFDHLEQNPLAPAYIIKSRRLGMSTGLGLYSVDKAIFGSGWRSILIDRKQAEADKKMVEILRFGVDNVEPSILSTIRFDKRNDSELRFRVGDEPESLDSVLYATVAPRGGDCSMLHVSEWGPIAATDKKRSAEIRSGAFPAARKGRRVIETTWMGGKYGDLWELVKPILERDPNALGRIFFFPWHCDPASIKLDGSVTHEAEDYFKTLASRLSKSFSAEQKKWWCVTKMEQGAAMSREYPSTLDEAFSAIIEGAIYAQQVNKAQSESRVCHLPLDRTHPVYTFWDLGSPRNQRTIYVQFIGQQIHIIDYDDGLDVELVDRVARIKAKGYPLAEHLLPHDGATTGMAGKSYAQQLETAGLANIRIIPRCNNVWSGIEETQSLMDRMVFDADKCKELLVALSNYREEQAKDGSAKGTIVHDRHSHGADALRMIAEAMAAGMIKLGSQPRVRSINPFNVHEPRRRDPRIIADPWDD